VGTHKDIKRCRKR